MASASVLVLGWLGYSQSSFYGYTTVLIFSTLCKDFHFYVIQTLILSFASFLNVAMCLSNVGYVGVYVNI